MSELNSLATFAISLEERGEGFYRRAAEKAADQEVKQVFLRLAEDEQEHARHFRLMVRPGAPAPNPEAARYVQAVLANPEALFPSLAEAAEAGERRSVLALAIQTEKDSILLYEELLALAAADDERQSLLRILKAEKFHLLELRDLFDEQG